MNRMLVSCIRITCSYVFFKQTTQRFKISAYFSSVANVIALSIFGITHTY